MSCINAMQQYHSLGIIQKIQSKDINREINQGVTVTASSLQMAIGFTQVTVMLFYVHSQQPLVETSFFQCMYIFAGCILKLAL